MLNLRFSRLPRHRKFSYKPIYYDENQEKLEAQIDRIKREMSKDPSDQQTAKENIRRAFSERLPSDRFTSVRSNRFYPLKIVFIASIIAAILYKLLTSDALKIIFESFSK